MEQYIKASQELEALALYGLSRVAHAEEDEITACQLGQESLALLEPTQHFVVDKINKWVNQLTNC
jgi:hypothetical protein